MEENQIRLFMLLLKMDEAISSLLLSYFSGIFTQKKLFFIFEL